jgi:hypothetical protein
MNKIYLACFHFENQYSCQLDDVMGYALAEDGHGLCSHFSSHEAWSKHDLGLNSDWKHEIYEKKYPEGYELIWIDDPDHDERWLKAVELNKALTN